MCRTRFSLIRELSSGILKSELSSRIKKSNSINDIKCSMVERLIRTLKSRIWRYFHHVGHTRYIDKLQDFVYSYNNSVHKAHNKEPEDVTQDNSLEVFETLYGDMLNEPDKKKPRYKVGDRVRISKNKLEFEKGYEARFKEEVYTITKVITHAAPVYEIEDHSEVAVAGSFYEWELSLVRGYEQQEFFIEKVLKRRVYRRKKQVFVRWLNYGADHDSWIDEDSYRWLLPLINNDNTDDTLDNE